MPVYIEKSGDLVGCHHSGTTTTTEKGKIGLLSQWTMDGGDEQLSKRSFLVEESPPPIKCSIRGQQKMTRRSSRRPRCCCLRAYADVEIPPDCQIQRSTISGEIIFFLTFSPILRPCEINPSVIYIFAPAEPQSHLSCCIRAL